MKGWENLSLWSLKVPKRANRRILWRQENSLVKWFIHIYVILVWGLNHRFPWRRPLPPDIKKETVRLQHLKGMPRSELVTWKGTIYHKKVYEKGTFAIKNGIYKGKGLDCGAEPPGLKLCCAYPLPREGTFTTSWQAKTFLSDACQPEVRLFPF